MRKTTFAGALLLGAALLFAPVDTAQAKEVPPDGNIPLASEYFPDGWFLKDASGYDKDKDGLLSPKEVADVTAMNCLADLTDFTSIQYFTNLRELELDSYGEIDDPKGAWVGQEIDLTVFPNLEKARISLDTGKAPAGSAEVQIKVSGLTHLKSIEVTDQNKEVSARYDGQKVKIDMVDLRNTPLLESVRIYGVKGVLFDDRSRIKDLWLANIQEMPGEQIEKLTEMERLFIHGDMSDFTALDLSKCYAMKKLEIYAEHLETVMFSGADQLEFIRIESKSLQEADLSDSGSVRELHLICPELTGIDVSENQNLQYLNVASSKVKSVDLSANQNLKELFLACPALDTLTLAGADALERVSIDESALNGIDISKNQRLKELLLTSTKLGAFDAGKNPGLEYLGVDSDRLKAIDITKNAGLKKLYVSSNIMKTLNLKKNRVLEVLGIHCGKMCALDLSANTKLAELRIDATPLKTLNLKKQKKLVLFQIKNSRKPPKLDLSANRNLKEVSVENTSYKKISLPKQRKLQKLSLTGNQKLEKVDLKNNKSLDWLIINGSKKMRGLDLTHNTKLQEINVKDNALKTLKLGGQKCLRYLYCQNNQLKVLDFTGVHTESIYEVWCDKGVKVEGYGGEVVYL